MEKGDKITVQVSALGTRYTRDNLKRYPYKRGTRIYMTSGEEAIVRNRTKVPPFTAGSVLVLAFDQIDKDGDMVYKLCSKNN